MFLITVTPAAVEARLPDLRAASFEVKGQAVRVHHGTSFVHFEAHDDGFTLLESPVGASESEGEVVMTRVRLTPGRLEVVSTPGSSRSLYYHFDGRGGFYCATHVRLLRAAGVELRENVELLPDYFVYRQLLPPYTMFAGISQLAKGELTVRITREGCVLQREVMYDPFAELGSSIADEELLTRRAREMFETMVGDLDSRRERVGVLLSGGMDSSVLTRVAQSRLGLTRSYSGGYPFEAERDNRERRYAETAAEAFGTEHRYFQTSTLGYMEDLVRAIAAVEEPVHHQQTVCALSLFREALLPDEDVVLSGMGAGGVFGTPLQQLIHRYRLAPTLYRSLAVGPVRRALQLASRASGRGIKLLKTIALTGRVDVAPADPASPVWSMDAYGSADWARAYFGVGQDGLARSRAHLLSRFDGRSLLEMITVFDQYDKTALLWGKAAQATGKILYLPFMQKRLHHLMLATPWPLQLGSNKHILARVGRQVGIPDSILLRAKSGFGVRRKDWALRGGPLEPLVPVAAKGFDEAEIRRMQSDDPVELNMFWNMLNYGLWKRLCIDGEPVEALLAELHAGAAAYVVAGS